MKMKIQLLILGLLFAPLVIFSQVLEKTYEKFDFIQGDKVLFEDNFQNESPNEIPSYWVVSSGRVEVSMLGNELCLGLLKSAVASPRKKGKYSLEDKLTLEFDYIIRDNSRTWSEAIAQGAGSVLKIMFITDKELYETVPDAYNKLGDFKDGIQILTDGKVDFNEYSGRYSLGEKGVVDISKDLIDKWVHVSVAVNSRSLKVYLNSQRVLNAQINGGDVYSFQLSAPYASEEELGHQFFIKNVRIAEGGADPYKMLTSEGKFIAKGINFEVAKSTLMPESMGAINSIFKLMQDDPSLSFEIGGHTDSDGDDNSNLKLSSDRAESVKKKLVEMGVDPSRLTTKGYGETMPLNDNSTQENKANNRRVEFKKL